MVYLQLSGWFWQLPLPDFLKAQFNRLNIHITAIESTFQSFKKAKNLWGKDFRTSILLVQVQTRSKSIFWMFTQPIEIFIHPCTTTLHCSLRFQRSKSRSFRFWTPALLEPTRKQRLVCGNYKWGSFSVDIEPDIRYSTNQAICINRRTGEYFCPTKIVCERGK